MLHSMVMFIFSVFDLKDPKYGSKIQNYLIKKKFGLQANSNIQNSIVMCTSSVIDRKCPSRANLVHKIKIVSLSWNLVLWLIWIWSIQWWSSFLLISKKYPEVSFFVKFISKNENFLLKLKCGTYINSNM